MKSSDDCATPRRRQCALAASLLVAAGGVALTGAASPAPPEPGPGPTPSLEGAHINEVVGLAASETVFLDLDPTPGQPQFFTLPIEGRAHTIHLFPHTARSADYTLLVPGVDGALAPVEPGPARTLRGEVWEVPGSIVAGSMMPAGLHASIHLPDGNVWWVEPHASFLEGADPRAYVLYHAADVIGSGGLCGVTEQFIDAQGGEEPHAGGGPMELGGGGAFACAELACEADFAFYQDHGSSVAQTEARIEMVIEQVNIQYESQIAISHVITNITVRTSAALDPYTTDDPGDLLAEFRNWWLLNGGAIPRDVLQLFTGRNLSGSVIGIAWINGVCSNGLKYGVVQSDCCGSLACSADLSAHELGHNWGAGHCSCPGNTMNPSITCANDFTAGSIATISNFRNTADCLEDCDGTLGPVPPNDDCFDAIVIGSGLEAFTTVNATTDGPAHPQCMEANDGGQTYQDIWFSWTAPCTGEVTVTTCEQLGGWAGYDTDLVVYDGTDCGNLQFLACNDDDPDNDCGGAQTSQSTVIAPVEQNRTYLIRVGGWNSGDQGSGVLSVMCSGDINGACCYPDGACAFVTSADCATTGGSYNGDGTSCTPFTCPQPTGACCVNNECYEISAINCAASIGLYLGDDTPCDGNPCAEPTGGCCLQGECFVLTSGECDEFGGLYQGDGADCGGVSCPPATGACCVSGACTVETEADCAASGGDYQGHDARCTAGLCALPVGACCLDGACTQETAADCAATGGTYEGDGVPCGAGTCSPATGACCIAGGCVEDTADDCAAAGGAYSGDGSDCATAGCPTGCPADITGPIDGVPDGNVDSLDFLRLISQWGSPCPGACDADISGPAAAPDGNVDALDYLLLIGQWGTPGNC